MLLRNSTALDSMRLSDLFRRHAAGWPTDRLYVAVRYSRSTPFSGSCYYKTGRIFINVGRGVRYPYWLDTHVARAVTTPRCWYRDVYRVEITDAYRLALFIFLHELYHWLVRQARRNVRQKEGRCDRFAVRALVDHHGAAILDRAGRVPPRESWDFQDLDGFVAAARVAPLRGRKAARRSIVSAAPTDALPKPITPPASTLFDWASG